MNVDKLKEQEDVETNCNRKYNDSLRGYGREVFKKYWYKCVYCEEDFSSDKMWLFLTVEHVVPLSMKKILEDRNIGWFREDPDILKKEDNLRPACRFCNGIKNRDPYSDCLDEDSFKKTLNKVLNKKKADIPKRRNKYLEFYQKCIKPDMEEKEKGEINQR